jgi:hypothetical protein
LKSAGGLCHKLNGKLDCKTGDIRGHRAQVTYTVSMWGVRITNT